MAEEKIVDITPYKIGLRIALARMSVRIRTRDELAERLTKAGYKAITGRGIGKWEEGKVQRAPVDAIPFLAKVTGQSENYFYGLEPLKENFRLGSVVQEIEESGCVDEDLHDWFGESGGARTLDTRIKSPVLYL